MLSRVRLTTAAALLAICLSAFAQQEQISAEKLATIKQLMQITGASTNSEQFSKAFSQQLISVLRLGNPDISQRAVDIVQEEVHKMVAEEFAGESLQREIYLIYARYFSLEELKGLVSFNQSAIGTKANKVMPLLMQDSVTAAQIWSEDISPKISARVLNRLREEGISVRVRTRE